MEAAGIGILFIIVLIILAVAISLAGLVFWVWMLIDCLTQEPEESNEKWLWALVIIFVEPLIGALIYYLLRRPERIRQYGH